MNPSFLNNSLAFPVIQIPALSPNPIFIHPLNKKKVYMIILITTLV